MNKILIKDDLLNLLKKKPAATEFANDVISNADIIPSLLEVIRTDQGSTKLYCGKIILILSETQPVLLYPFFEEIVLLLDHRNKFILWGAIQSLSNLVSIDNDNKFPSIYEKYFNLINSVTMITAGNVVKNAWKIIRKYPEYENDIVNRLIRITDNTYLNKGKPSPECKNILIGQTIDCFNKFFMMSGNKEKIIEFVSCQRNNPRKQTAKRAEVFLGKIGK